MDVSLPDDQGAIQESSNQFEQIHLLIVTIFTIILLPFIFIGNTLILLALKRIKNLRSVTLFYIGQLALSDIAFGVVMVLRVVLIFSFKFHFNRVACQIVLHILFVSGGSALSAILLLSMEGYLSVRFFIFFKLRYTRTVAYITSFISVTIWIILISIGFIIPNPPAGDLTDSCTCHLGNQVLFDKAVLKVIVILLWGHVLLIFVFLLGTFLLIRGHNKLFNLSDRREQNCSGVSGQRDDAPKDEMLNSTISSDITHRIQDCERPEQCTEDRVKNNDPIRYRGDAFVKTCQIVENCSPSLYKAKGQVIEGHTIPNIVVMDDEQPLSVKQPSNPLNEVNLQKINSKMSLTMQENKTGNGTGRKTGRGLKQSDILLANDIISGNPSVRKVSHKNQPVVSQTATQMNWLKRLNNMTKLIALVLFFFSLAWFPYFVVITIVAFCDSCLVENVTIVYVSAIVMLSSLFNVFIFSFKSTEFKQSFKRTVCCSGNNSVESA